MLNIAVWGLTVEILGLASLPALRAFFGNRRDAALLSRPLGLAVAAWIAWALSLVLPFGFSRGTILLSLLVLAAASLLAQRSAPREPGGFWGEEENRGALFFWAPAAVFLAIRAAVPEVLGAEKFMDLAFFNSLTRHPDMPPVDPWMAGKTINYYYWGYLLAAVPTKLAGIDPLVAYNLGIATFAGYAFASAACLGFRLSRGRTAAGVAAGFVSVFAGNLTGAFDAWARPFAKDFDYWHASRVIGAGKTINEFPFFTFFHADLHPHLLAYPFFLAAFAVADRWIEAGRKEPGVQGQKPRADPGAVAARAGSFFLVAVLAATAIAGNLWNAPAIAILLVGAGLLRASRGEGLPRPGPALTGAFVGAATAAAALVLIQPYRRSYALPYNGIGRTHAVSGLLEFLGVWGILFAVAAVGLLLSQPATDEAARRRRDFFLAAAGLVAVAVGLLSKTPALAPILLLAFLAGRAAWSSLFRDRDRETVFAALLCLLALGMIAGCEFVYFKDNYGDDLHRMNTVFKFYHQAWPLAGIGAVVFAERAWRRAGRRRALALVFAAAAFVALLYPATAAVSRLRQQQGAFSLDARTGLRRRNAADLAAIEWLRVNAPRGSVVIEASADPYSEFARVSSHTGIPTVLGWANHEGLWRSNSPEVLARLADVRRFYSSPDAGSSREILDRYGVTHVVLGDLERRTYSPALGPASLAFLRPAHQGETVVYRVVSEP